MLNYNRYIHNQTGNIYTQVLGVLVIGIIGRDLFRVTEARFPAASQEDFIVFGCFLFSLITCLLLSFTFHTICNHSQEAQQFWLNLDFMGLLIAASGGFVPGIWYTFYCTPRKIKIFLIGVGFVLTSAYLT